MFISAVAPTLVHFVQPVAQTLRDEGWETIGVAEGATASDAFDRVCSLPPFRRRGPVAHARALRALHRIIGEQEPDIVHLHTPAAVALGRLAAASRMVPSVAVIHGTFLDSPSAARIAFAVGEAGFAWLSRATVVVNRDDRLFYERWCPKGSVAQAPAGGSGVDIQEVDFEGPAVPRALYLGRLSADKNLDFLVDAWTLARKSSPGLELRIVGDPLEGDPPWAPPNREGLERISWTDDPSNEINRASVLVTASRREGFSMVVAEAICAGIPVVALENRGTRQIARDVDKGLTLVPMERERFARALADAVSRGERQPRRDLMDQWGHEEVVEFHCRFIAECLGFHRSRQ
jgi:glycosyltransferase involved in cell wall biosynthesis